MIFLKNSQTWSKLVTPCVSAGGVSVVSRVQPLDTPGPSFPVAQCPHQCQCKPINSPLAASDPPCQLHSKYLPAVAVE